MILVSGATGFVGSYVVCELLLQNKKVRALKRAASTLSEFEFICTVNNVNATQLQNLEWHTADILDLGNLEPAFEGIEEVIHCAAIVSFFKKDKEEMLRVNVEGTANMVNLALQFGVKKFGHISSIAAIGRSAEGSIINENTKWENSENNTGYAESKFAGEMEVWRGMQEGLKAVIVNPGIIIGACDFNGGTGKLFKTLYHGLQFYTLGANGFVDVRDVTKCMLQLLDKNIFNERFILVSENYAFKRFYDEVAVCFNKPKPKFNTPLWMGIIGYKLLALGSLFTRKEPLLTKETTHAAYKKFFYDNSKIRERLNINFIPVKETVEWTCGWYK